MNASTHPPCPDVTALDVDVRDGASLLRALADRVVGHAGIAAADERAVHDALAAVQPA